MDTNNHFPVNHGHNNFLTEKGIKSKSKEITGIPLKTGARGEILHEKIIRNQDTAFGDAAVGKKMKCQVNVSSELLEYEVWWPDPIVLPKISMPVN